MFPLYDLNPHHRFPYATVVIIALNAGAMLLMSGLSDTQSNVVAFRYGFLPVRASLVNSGKELVVPVPAFNGRNQMVIAGTVELSTNAVAVYSTFLTTMFLHGGWMHMLSNMWILWVFGNNIEDRLGHFLYVLYYLVGGVAATCCHWAINVDSELPVIGASGAVAAVLGGYAFCFPWAKIRTLVFVGIPLIFDIPALAWLGIWFVLQNVIPGLVSLTGVSHDPVAYWAHIGGFVAGVVLMPPLSLIAPRPPVDPRQYIEDVYQPPSPQMRSW